MSNSNSDVFGEPLQQMLLHEQVADRIRTLILTESLQIGERLPSERVLAERLGVSRLVVRDALKVLNGQGLVEIKTGSGTYVTQLTNQQLMSSIGLYLKTRTATPLFHKEVLELRRSLEVEIAGLAAERATAEDILQLQEAIDLMAANVDNPEVFTRSDLAFHETLAKATHNQLFQLILGPISDVLLEFRLVAHQFDPQGAVTGGLTHHRQILDYVRAKDPQGARKAMLHHMEQAQTLYENALDSGE